MDALWLPEGPADQDGAAKEGGQHQDAGEHFLGGLLLPRRPSDGGRATRGTNGRGTEGGALRVVRRACLEVQMDHLTTNTRFDR